jgi:succinate dehydrogenase / fumarate reductase, membrane anchor subunit
MVNKLTNITSLTRNGLRDWVVQRVSSIILALYVLFLLGFILFNPSLDYFTWQQLFANGWMRIFSLLTLLSLMAHAWVGMWTIVTDYIKPPVLRLLVQVIIVLALIIYFIWGVEILWGIS